MEHFSRFLSEYLSTKEQVLYFSVKDNDSYKLRIEIRKTDELRVKAALMSAYDGTIFIERGTVFDKTHLDKSKHIYSINLIRETVDKLISLIQDELKDIQKNIPLDKESLKQIK